MADSPIQPSFIPHEAVAAAAPKRQVGGGLSELILLIAIIILIVSAALAAGVFLYQQYLQASNQNKLAQLQSAQSAFNPSLVEQITTLNDRMTAAQTLLSQHLAPSLFFGMLASTTVQDISFSSLNYDATNPQQITLTMSGVAGSVNSIALQAQVFSQGNIITDPIFSDINAQSDGVHFDFTALINPASITYGDYVNGSSPSAAAVQPVQQQTQQVQQAAPAPASPFQGTSAPASSTPPTTQ